MSDSQRLLQLKAALMQTTSTVGWVYVRQLSDKLVDTAIQEALDEEDPTKGETKRRKAKAMQQGFNHLFAVIEGTKAFGTDDEPDWFSQLNAFEELADGNSSQGN